MRFVPEYWVASDARRVVLRDILRQYSFFNIVGHDLYC